MTYSLIEIFGEIMKEQIAPFFKKHGYKKRNLNFYKVENGLTFLCNFQKGAVNSTDYVSFYINCGIYCDEFESIVGEEILPNPKEYDCLFRERTEQITKSGNQQFEITESSEAGKSKVSGEILTECEKVIEFFESVKTIDDLVKLSIERHTYFYEKVFKYLCIKKDFAEAETFFQKFGEIFKDDDRYLFFEARLNAILTANGVEPMKFKAAIREQQF